MLGELVTEDMELPGEARGCAEMINNEEVLGCKPSFRRKSVMMGRMVNVPRFNHDAATLVGVPGSSKGLLWRRAEVLLRFPLFVLLWLLGTPSLLRRLYMGDCLTGDLESSEI